MTKPVLIVLAFVLLLAGCGQARDPFVGTWQRSDAKHSVPLVIRKGPTGYQVVVQGPRAPKYGMTRQGDELIDGRVSMTYDRQTGRLRFTDGKHIGYLSKVSDSTAIPVVSPSPSPLAQLAAVARQQRADHAWYAEVPYYLAANIMGGDFENSSDRYWLAVMHGDFTDPGRRHYAWQAVMLDPNGSTTTLARRRIKTFGAHLKPLPLK